MKYSIHLTLTVALFLALAGCAGVKDSMRPSEKISQWNPISKITKSKKDEDANPETMAVLWSDTVLEKPGTAPVRGFGGRIFFYDNDNQAVKADGELIVYGFDDSTKSNSGTPKADRKFVFQQERFQSHFSESQLGASYSVWVPWEKVGGFRKSISLLPIFRTADGRVLKSASSINVLPGKSLPQQTAKRDDIRGIKRIGQPSSVSQAAFEASGNAAGEVAQASLLDERSSNLGRVRTSTIDLTPGLASRMSQPVVKKTTTTQASNNVAQQGQLTDGAETKPIVKDASETVSSTTTTVESNRMDEKKAESSSQRRVFGKPGAFR